MKKIVRQNETFSENRGKMTLFKIKTYFTGSPESDPINFPNKQQNSMQPDNSTQANNFLLPLIINLIYLL